jgi:hypothetical protein
MLDLSQEPQTQHVSDSMKRDWPKDDESTGGSSRIPALSLLDRALALELVALSVHLRLWPSRDTMTVVLRRVRLHPT